MKKALIVCAAVVVGLGAAVWLFIQPESPPDHRVFLNGQVLSMDAENRIHEALSVRGKHIEKLGTSAEIEALIGADTVVTDLQGQTLMPGFIDAHDHFPGSGMTVVAADLSSPPVGGINTISELQDALRARLADNKGRPWLVGSGYDDTLLAEQRHPTREELDAVSTEVPIYIIHVSMHMGVANSKALQLLGITADSEDPVGGVISRQVDGREPAGLLAETAHFPPMAFAMDFSTMDALDMARVASAEYVALGVTTAQSGGVDASMANGLAYLSRFGLVLPRLIFFGFYNTLGAAWLDGSFDPASIESERVAVPAIKIVADGSIQGYTGYLSQPYHVPYKGEESYRGYPSVPREDLIREVARFHAAGIQMAIHGNGDASIDDILDAFEMAQAEHPVADPRLILIHAQMARDDQLVRMKALGVTPSFFSAHTYYWGDRHRDIFMGRQRAYRMSPAKSAEAIGLRYSVHLDTPVVPMNPLQLVWSTVTRQSYGGDIIGPEQRVSPMNALRAVTIEAAWQVFQEDRIGSLEPGKLADLVVLSGSPLENVQTMRDLQITETLIGGVSVYSMP